ncbi:FecR domain-containing protein [Candidatus Dependentiae bacterium]|nr:FecR domain-containing protein [Candidatus Dependentiae bacterium]
MIKKYGIRLNVFIFTFVFMFVLTLNADDLIKVEVDYVEGIAHMRSAGTNYWETIKPGMLIMQGADIRTGNGGVVDLKFDEKTYVRVGENTTTKVEQAEQSEYEVKKLFFSKKQPQKKISLNMEKGSLLSKVGKLSSQSSFNIKTPTSVCGVRGTLFSASHNYQTSVKVLNGIVVVSNISIPGVQAVVMPGQSTSVAPGEVPEPPRQMTPSEVGEVRGLLEGSSATAAPMNESAAPGGSQNSGRTERTASVSEIKSEVAAPVVEPIRPPDSILNSTTTAIIENVVNTVTKPNVIEKSKLQINVNLK